MTSLGGKFARAGDHCHRQSTIPSAVYQEDGSPSHKGSH